MQIFKIQSLFVLTILFYGTQKTFSIVGVPLYLFLRNTNSDEHITDVK